MASVTIPGFDPTVLPAATSSAQGAMSAADKAKEDLQPTRLYGAPFTAVTSVAVPAWTPAAYRRLEIHLSVTTKSSTGDVTIATSGITAGYYVNQGVFAIGSANAPTDAQHPNAATFIFASSIGPYQLDLLWNIPTVGQKSFTGKSQLNQGNQVLLGGLCIDATHAVADLTIASADTMTGYLEVLGYP